MENLLWYNKPADNFEEALPLGNGKMGAMVYGRSDTEKISLNEDSLWTGYPCYDDDNADAYNVYSEMKKLFKQNKRYDAQELLEKGFSGGDVQSYLPAGNILIKMGDCEYTEYIRSLDLACAVAKSRYMKKECEVKTETFISGTDNVLAHSIVSSEKHDFEITLESPLKHTVSVCENMLILAGSAPDNREYKPELFTYNRNDTIKYTIALKPVTDGKISFKNGIITVKNAARLILYLSVKTSYTAWNRVPDAEHASLAAETVKHAAEKGYEALKRTHISDFSSYFNRVKLNISKDTEDMPTDERIKSEEKTAGLMELLFNFGRYLIISASRKDSLAANLQGIWNEELIAPWGSEYTTNINTQMNYWPVLMCNLPEFMQPLIDLIKITAVSGKNTANKYYRADGFAAHHNYDIWGKTTPAPGSARWSYWCMSAGWMCRHLFEYYRYTNDIKFLEETAFPIMYEAANFYMQMFEEDNGKLIITPSTSPENGYIYNGKTVYLAKFTTMTQAIIMDLFKNLTDACEILGKNDLKKELMEKYPLEKFNTYKIGSKGQLLEYDEEYPEEDVHHRHISHLYGLFPGESITTDDKILSEACKKSLEIRGDNGTGWSLGWKANLWSKLKDGNHALKIIKTQLKYVPASKDFDYHFGGTYANLFDAHPPFQIDGNFGVTAGIVQMFLQCENDVIKILPALPDEFKNGSVEGLSAKGNIIVSMWWSEGKAVRIKLFSPFEQIVRINVQNGEIRKIKLEANKEFTEKV